MARLVFEYFVLHERQGWVECDCVNGSVASVQDLLVALPFDVTCSDIADIVDVQIVCKLCSDFWRLCLNFSGSQFYGNFWLQKKKQWAWCSHTVSRFRRDKQTKAFFWRPHIFCGWILKSVSQWPRVQGLFPIGSDFSSLCCGKLGVGRGRARDQPSPVKSHLPAHLGGVHLPSRVNPTVCPPSSR